MKNRKLKEILLSPKWIEGTQVMSAAGLVSHFFKDWVSFNGFQFKSLSTTQKFAKEFGEEPALANCAWDYLRQVNNGGHDQWFLNGYASDEEEDTVVKDWMIESFKKYDLSAFPSLQRGIDLCKSAIPHAENLFELDKEFYSFNDEFQNDLSRWMEEFLDIKFESTPDPTFKKIKAFMDRIYKDNQPRQERAKSAQNAMQRLMKIDMAFSDLKKNLGRLPTAEELAEKTKEDLEMIKEILASFVKLSESDKKD